MEISKDVYLNALRLIIEKDEVFNHISSLVNSYNKINFINNNQAICKDKNSILELIINGDILLILNKTYDKNFFEKIEYAFRNNQIEIEYELKTKTYNKLLDMNYMTIKKDKYVYTKDYKLLSSEKMETTQTSFNDEKMKRANDKFKVYETLYLTEDDRYFRFLKLLYDKDVLINKYEVSNKKIDNILTLIDAFDNSFDKLDKASIKKLSLSK